jgi:Flp pilus assembly pilin Flp
MILTFLKDERGTAAVEYALIASILVLAIVTALGELGLVTSGWFANEELRAALGGSE